MIEIVATPAQKEHSPPALLKTTENALPPRKCCGNSGYRSTCP